MNASSHPPQVFVLAQPESPSLVCRKLGLPLGRVSSRPQPRAHPGEQCPRTAYQGQHHRRVLRRIRAAALPIQRSRHQQHQRTPEKQNTRLLHEIPPLPTRTAASVPRTRVVTASRPEYCSSLPTPAASPPAQPPRLLPDKRRSKSLRTENCRSKPRSWSKRFPTHPLRCS